jgi:hypothetical protein
MKRFFTLSLVLAAAFFTISVITACTTTPSQTTGGTVGSSSPSSLPTIEIVNNTGFTFYYLHVSSSESIEWGDSVLGDNVLEDGGSFTYQLTQPLSSVNTYDFAAEDEDGDPYYKFDIVVVDGTRIIFTLEDIYFDE